MKIKKKVADRSVVAENGEILINDGEIESAEALLLPSGCHFADDAREVIRCWHSTDVSACPGSGKTTVLLAKLKILADRMPFADNSGICVLSHTNVAVDEIKARLEGCASKLLAYPSYVGTIQTFIDKFVTMPYLKREYGRNIQPIDSRTYALHMLRLLYAANDRYPHLRKNLKLAYEKRKGNAKDRAEFVGSLFIREDGSLCLKGQTRALASADRPSTAQYRQLVTDMIQIEGMIKYADAYKYADLAVKDLTDEYTELFNSRFRYVFVDEYQDCNQAQRNAVEKLFDRTKSCVMHIGDPDQAIYSSREEKTEDWRPKKDSLTIASSNRFGQEIADILSPLPK